MKDDTTSNNDKANSDSFYILDAELLPLIEKADNGCFDAQMDLSEAFTHGEGAKINNKLASKYGRMLFESTDNNRLKLGILWNEAILEKEAGNYEEMVAGFHVVINFMQENMPMDEWDFSLFAQMEEFTQFEE